MLPRPLGFLALTFVAVTAVSLAAAASSIVECHALDGVPERIGTRPAKYPEALRATGTAEDVRVSLVIDLDGSVRDIESVDASQPAFAEAAREAVKDWRFQSGYVKGLPTRYRVRAVVPFRLKGMEGGLDPAGASDGLIEVAEPEVEYSVSPPYPAELADTPRDGLALVNLLVDAVGTPSDPVVEYATHPAFAQAARDAVLAWEFSSAERDGGLVSARTTVAVRFRAEDAAKSAEQRLLEAQFAHVGDYDVAPEPVKQVAMVYPYVELLENKRSTVSLTLLISPEGQVVDVVPDPGSNSEFAMAAAACVTCWRFNPATKAGQPVYSRMKWQMVFTERSGEMQFDDASYELLTALRAGTFKSASPRELDRPIAFKERVGPEFIPGQASVAGDVLIDLIIDPNGRPQLPRVLTAPSVASGYAAATAALRWRFEPPRVQGQPAFVRVKIPFKITPAAAAPAADSAAPAAPTN